MFGIMMIWKGVKRRMIKNISHIAFTGSLVTINNLVVKKTAESIVIDFTMKSVTTDGNCSNAGTDSDSGEESKVDEEAHEDAYENMYAQWLRVCNKNRALVSKNSTLVDFKVNQLRNCRCWKSLCLKKKEK